MNVLLEGRGVSKRFGGLLAVSDVSFTLHEGEILGLIGPNGAGKTTLFNIINGVYPNDGGTFTFAGQDITGWPPNKLVHAGLARTFQVVKPLNEMTVLDNVTVGACFGREYLGLKAARHVALEVLDHDDGHSLTADGADQFQHLRHFGRIQAGEHFIQQQQLGFRGQGASHFQPLLERDGEMFRQDLGAIGHVHSVQHLQRHFVRRAQAQVLAAEAGPNRDVVQHGHFV